MIAECFDLSLQCDAHLHVYRASFTAMTRRGAWQQARAAGWKITKQSDLALCRHCARRLKAPAERPNAVHEPE